MKGISGRSEPVRTCDQSHREIRRLEGEVEVQGTSGQVGMSRLILTDRVSGTPWTDDAAHDTYQSRNCHLAAPPSNGMRKAATEWLLLFPRT